MKSLMETLSIREITNKVEELRNLRKEVQAKLRSLPDGNLDIIRNGRYSQWEYRTCSDKEVKRIKRNKWRIKFLRESDDSIFCSAYLSKSQRCFASKVLEHEFLVNLLNGIDVYIDAVQDCISKLQPYFSKEQKILEHPEKLRLLDADSAEMRAELKAWEEAEYETNPYHLEQLVNPTLKGHMVRSKSEMMLADAFYENGIPYRYEEKNVINGFVHYTDFALRHPITGKHFKLEHNGMMDIPEYAQKTGYRLVDYSCEGYILGRNFFMTMETRAHPLTKAEVQAVVDAILNDYSA